MLESLSPLPSQYEPYLNALGWIKHPFAVEVFDSRIPLWAGHLADLLHYKSQKFIEDGEKEDWDSQISLLERPYRLSYATHLINNDIATGQAAIDLLTFAWTDAHDIHELQEHAIKAFRKTGFIADDNQPEPTEPITVFRGGFVSGMSWTKDLSTAKWFAARFECGYGKSLPIFEATAQPESVLALFDRRDEKEVVVEPDKLINIDLVVKPYYVQS